VRVNLRSRRAVLIGLAAVCLAIFLAGMGAAWHERHHTICKDGKPPVRQRGTAFTPTEYQCHDGQMVTQ
jgi:hypothetical protein